MGQRFRRNKLRCFDDGLEKGPSGPITGHSFRLERSHFPR